MILRGSLRSLLPLAVVALLGLACESRVPEKANVERPAPREESSGPKLFGAPLRSTETVALATVLTEPGTFEGKTLLVEGDVRRACSKKGCWMELATSSDESAPGCRVTFQDYGFFVPTNSAGSRAKVEGRVELSTVPKARVDHLEAEGARFASKNPDGTANEVRIVATGVELTRRS